MVCEACGNGNVQFSESCDDGNLVNGDGCDSLCNEETGYTCNGEPSLCSPTCGDGRLISPEVCDDGPSSHSYISTPRCKNDCTGADDYYECTGGNFTDPTSCIPDCGDNVRIGTEACDDGDNDDTSNCKADCSGPVTGYIC